MEKNFTDGLIAKKPHENAPDFIKARISIKTEDFVRWLEQNTNGAGWCDIDIKESKGGKWYGERNTYEKPDSAPKDDIRPEDVPF